MPDELYGEQVMAWVRMRQGAADFGSAEASLKEHCRGEPRSALALNQCLFLV